MYVDDTIVASNNLSLIMDIENTLAQTLEMTLLGNIHFLLGNRIVLKVAYSSLNLHTS
jgi:hypothetical protein